MLGSERQRASGREAEFGRDSPVRRGGEEIRFESVDRQQVYAWVEGLLVGQQYAQQGSVARGLLRRYIEKITD